MEAEIARAAFWNNMYQNFPRSVMEWAWRHSVYQDADENGVIHTPSPPLDDLWWERYDLNELYSYFKSLGIIIREGLGIAGFIAAFRRREKMYNPDTYQFQEGAVYFDNKK